MTFADAKAAIRAHIATQWAAGAYADVAVLWENESPEQVYDRFVFVSIDGVDARKTVYGAAGKRMSKEDGIVFIHAFVPQRLSKDGERRRYRAHAVEDRHSGRRPG